MTTNASSRVSLVPGDLGSKEWQRKVATWMLEVNQGHIQNTGTTTLTPNSATTIVIDYRAGANSFIAFMPLTATAATEFSAGTLFVSTQGKQTFTITHTNSAVATRTFRYCILG